MRKLSFGCALLLIALQLFALASCSVKRPHDILSQGKMEDILYDYHLARSVSDNLPYDQSYKEKYYIQGVLDKYGISTAVFDSSMAWYSRHTDEMADIYDNVQKRLKENLDDVNKLISANEHNSTSTASGDSLNLWTSAKTVRLSGDDINNRMTFKLSPDTTFHPRDAFEWTVNYIASGNDMAHIPFMSLSVRYDNDSIITQTIRVQGSGMRVLRVQNVMSVSIREVSGFIYVPKGARTACVARIVALKRFHAHGPAPTTPMPTGPVGGPPGMPANQQMQGAVNVPPGTAIGKTPPSASTPAGANPNAPGTDTSKTALPPHRLTPAELNRKRSETATPRDYQVRQQELEKELMKTKKPAKKNAHP
jgi:head-tail adaptor/ubiquitin